MTRHLHNDMVQRHFVIKSLAGAEHTVIANHAGFDGPSANRFNDARNYARMREVDFLDALMCFGEYLALWKVRDRQMRSDAFVNKSVQKAEQEIVAVRHGCAPLPCRREHNTLSHRRLRTKPSR